MSTTPGVLDGPGRFDIVAIGSSAGGIEALQAVISALPARFAAAVLVVQHLDPRHQSLLATLLGRHAQLRVKEARHGDRIAPGTAYIAPPDHHLLVAGGHVELSRSKLVNFSRPSVDLLFESVAGEYGPRALAVVLTGSGVDGAMGISAVKRTGGVTLAESASTAAHRGMPAAAYATGCVDHVLPLDAIGPMLVNLVGTTATSYEPTR